ncbi:hypothetical protein TSOC_014636, partial [Tetrabaena socialis]
PLSLPIATLCRRPEARSLPDYLASRFGPDPPPVLIEELDRTNVYDTREEMLPANPQERESQRLRPLARPYMRGSRVARRRLVAEQLFRRAELNGEVDW